MTNRIMIILCLAAAAFVSGCATVSEQTQSLGNVNSNTTEIDSQVETSESLIDKIGDKLR